MSRIDKINLILATSTLVLVKASGLGLALIAYFIILSDQIINYRLKNWRYFLLLFVFFIGFNRSWSIFLKLNQVGSAWDTNNVSISKFMEILLGRGQTYQIQTFTNFCNNIFNQNLLSGFFNMTAFTWIVVSILISFTIIKYVRDPQWASRLKIMCIGVHLGYVAYFLSLLILYVFTYSEYEALKLASISRYLRTYILGVYVLLGLIILLALKIKSETRTSKPKIKGLVGVIAIMLLFNNSNGIQNTFLLNKIVVNESIQKRRPYSAMTQASKRIGADKRIYFISQNNSGQDYWTARFIFTPNQINPNFTWSIGNHYGDKDIWTKKISVNEWKQELLNNYQFVYLYNIDDQFVNKYRKLFDTKEIVNNTLYRVDKNTRNQKILVKANF